MVYELGLILWVYPGGCGLLFLLPHLSWLGFTNSALGCAAAWVFSAWHLGVSVLSSEVEVAPGYPLTASSGQKCNSVELLVKEGQHALKAMLKAIWPPPSTGHVI